MTVIEFTQTQGRLLLQAHRTDLFLQLMDCWGPDRKADAQRLTRLIAILDEMIANLEDKP